MSLSTTQYGYIVDPMVPFTDDKGKTIKNGFIRVFMAGTSTPVLTYRNYDGATNQEKIELDNSGRVKHNVIGSKGSLYKVVVYNILHSQENPLLTVDKIAVLGASINATGATIITGLDSVTVQEENFIKATVEGTGVELALDPTEVTSDVNTISAAETAAPDYVLPLLDKTGTGDSKKISLANLFKFALDWISRLATTVTSFASGDFIAVSNTTNGARKMSKDTLLELTAQNALAGNVAEDFVENSTNAVAGRLYIHNDEVFKAKEDYNGVWNAAKFEKLTLSDYLKNVSLDAGYRNTPSNQKIGSLTPSGSYVSAVVYAGVGDVVYVRGICTASARVWATFDKNGYVLRRADSSLDSRTTPASVTLQGDEVGIVFNSEKHNNYPIGCFYSCVVPDSINALEKGVKQLDDELDDLSSVHVDEGFRSVSGQQVGQLTENSVYRSAIVYAHTGDTFVVRGIGTASARVWATFDKNGYVLRRADSSLDSRTTPASVTLQGDEVGIVFNSSYIDMAAYSNIGIRAKESLGEMLQKTIKETQSPSLNSLGDIEKIVKLPDGFTGEYKFPYTNKFNIRAKFVIKDNPYTFATTEATFIGYKRSTIEKDFTIKANTLQQATSTFDDDGETKTSYMPWLEGNVSLGGAEYNWRSNNWLGDIAFGIKYVGNETFASVSNDGTKLTVKKGGTTTDYPYSTYTTMGDLFNAVSADTDFELSYNILENHVPTDLAIFGECRLISEFKKNIGNGTDEVFTDKAALYIRYGTSGKIHQFEAYWNGGDYIVAAIDGLVIREAASRYSQIGDWVFFADNLSGHIRFEDIEICVNSSRDAELLDYRNRRVKVASSVNPMIIIYEGHGIVDVPSVNADSTSMDTTPDRLQMTFDLLQKKGYESVPLRDVIGYLDGQNTLPKRCYTLMFDDYRINDVLDLKKRKAFTTKGIFSNLAMVTSEDDPIIIDGQTITLEKAVSICKDAGVECWTHTRNHQMCTHHKYSEYKATFTADMYDADLKGINSSVLVYPNGATDKYVMDTLEFIGMRAAIMIVEAGLFPCLWQSKYFVSRIEIGMREDLADLISYIQ